MYSFFHSVKQDVKQIISFLFNFGKLEFDKYDNMYCAYCMYQTTYQTYPLFPLSRSRGRGSGGGGGYLLFSLPPPGNRGHACMICHDCHGMN